MPVRSLRPEDIDPLESAASELAPDGGYPTTGPAAQAVALLVNGGLSQEEALQRVREEQDAALAGFRERGARGRVPPPQAAPVNQMAVAEDMEPRSREELIDAGFQATSEMGPRMPDGSVRRPAGRQFKNEREAADYTRRPEFVAPGDPTLPGGTGRYTPSAKDDDMRANGYVPIYLPDGTVTYQLSPDNGVPGLPGAPGRAGVRADLEGPMRVGRKPVLDANGRAAPGFEHGERDGPTGPQMVYEQSDESAQRQDAYQAERMLFRLANQAHMSPAEFRAKYPEQFKDLGATSAGGTVMRPGVDARLAVQGARQEDADMRRERWQAQMLLGAGHPNGATKQVSNMLMSLPEDQRASAMRYMMPGGGMSAHVDASHNTQLTALGLRVAQNPSLGGMPPALAAAQADAMAAERRKNDPPAAGAEDLRSGTRRGSPEALAELTRLAEQHDSGDASGSWWLPFVGMGGVGHMSDRDEAALAATLERDYGMSKEDAARTAQTHADRRRWEHKKGGPQPPTPPKPGV